MERRVLLVGWDSADWQIIDPLVDAGKMPVLQQLIETGVSGRLGSLEPMVSPLLWTSIATGKRAYSHGIYSFTTSDPHAGTVRSVGSHHRTCRAVWNILHHKGRRSVICNWFASHPAEPVNGLVVSNEFPIIRSSTGPADRALRASVHPLAHWDRLADLRVGPEDIDGSIIKLLVPRAEEVNQKHDTRLARLAALLAENFNVHSAFTYGLEAIEWDFAAVYYEAIDLIAHYFMRYVAPLMPGVPRLDAEIYGEVVEGAYRLHDAMLGRLLQLAGPQTTVLLVSDHGFHSREQRPTDLPDIPLALTLWHRRQGVLVMNGPDVRRDELIYGASLLDITPTILTLFEVPVGQDMEGRVLAEAFEKTPHIAVLPSWDAIEGDFAQDVSAAESLESAHLLQRFIDLGYLAPGTRTFQTEAKQQWHAEQYFHAVALLDGQRAFEALPILDELHEAEPERDGIALTLATVLLRVGLLEEAQEVIDLLETTASSCGALLLRAELERRRGGREASVAALAVVEQMTIDSVQTLNFAGTSYLHLRQVSKAEEVFARSLALEKENPGALAGLSFCRSRQGHYREASELALEGISLLFHHFYSHYCYGIALIHLGEEKAAIRAFENTLRFHPGFHQARHYLIHLFKHRASATTSLEHHRAVLFQRGAEQVKSDFRRNALRDDVQIARTRRAATRAAHRGLALKREQEQRERPVLEFVIVSGLPRSGTSLTMQILEAAGIPAMTDGLRQPDEHNPHGYYEWDRIKQLPDDPQLIAEAEGRAVKVISALLPSLPRKHRYRIVFVRRDLQETIRSQNRLRERLTGLPPEDSESTQRQIQKHLEQTYQLLESAPNVQWIEIQFEKLLEKSDGEFLRLASFCGLDAGRLAEMKAAVKKVSKPLSSSLK